jgi:hypothetical protein
LFFRYRNNPVLQREEEEESYKRKFMWWKAEQYIYIYYSLIWFYYLVGLARDTQIKLAVQIPPFVQPLFGTSESWDRNHRKHVF